MVEEEFLGIEKSPDDVLIGASIDLLRRWFGICFFSEGSFSLKEFHGGGELFRSRRTGESAMIELGDALIVGEVRVLQKNCGPGFVGGELVADVLGIDQMKSLREIDVRRAFAFAGAVHIGTTKDGEEIRIGSELVVRELHGTDAFWLAFELILRVGDDIDPIEKNFGRKASRIKA